MLIGSAAIDWQRDASNEIRLVRRQKQCVCDVPAPCPSCAQSTRAHPARPRPAWPRRRGARVSTAIGVSINPGRMTFVAPYPEFRILNGDLLSEGNHSGFSSGSSVATLGYCSQAATDEIVMITPARCSRISGKTCQAGHDGAAQVDGGGWPECDLGDSVERRVTAGNAYTDIVVEDIDAPQRAAVRPRPPPRASSRPATSASNAKYLPRDRRAIYRNRFLGGGEIVVDCQHRWRLPVQKAQNRGTTVAQPFAR